MNSTSVLSGSYLRTYQAIFRHPAAHNLGWQDVHALFRHLGQVEEEANGNLKVTRNGQNLVLHPSRAKDVGDTDELMALRHFLERSETVPAAPVAATPHWLLVIDHRQARIFQAAAPGSVAQEIRPHAASDYFRHAHKSKDFSRGEEKPDPNSFFGPVARALELTGPILIFGTGTGTSSEMAQFTAWAQAHRPELAQRIIGTLSIDEHHLTDDQLLAKARAYYAHRASPAL